MLTLERIRSEGLKALRERAGLAGTIRFLSQFDNGRRDYASLALKASQLMVLYHEPVEAAG
ncbi:MAG: hypothetical protein O3C40_09565 [Planctomycetota bacterium]|nr:hypothetical protein [Planctomycetota bacterium]